MITCDKCDTNYHEFSDRIGGLMFGNLAICPLCSEKWIKNAINHGEYQYCKINKKETFFNFVTNIRNNG